MKEIYLDNSATTKTNEEVVEVMKDALERDYGNPSSPHELGERARSLIDEARKSIAKEINALPEEIIFTSGGTESNNLAIFGLAKANPKKRTIIISEIEHPSISEPCEYLKRQGYKLIKIPVNNEGIIILEELDKVLAKNKDILLVSIMHVNNIIGTIQPIEEIGKLCKKHNVIYHTDAVQSLGKLDIDVKKMNIDLLSSSGHKINGPKGIGFLYIKDRIKIEPLIYGGQQEKGIRSGTENVPGILGFSKALELVKKIDKSKVKKVRNELIEEIKSIGGKINGSLEHRIFNNVNVSFNVDADYLVFYLSGKGIYVSAGSACDSKKKKDDETLKAVGLTKKEIDGSIRIVLNEEIRSSDIDLVIKEIKERINSLQGLERLFNGLFLAY